MNQGELVAAQTRQGAEATTVGAQTVGQGQQQLVAGLIAELLVDPLEIIQADAEHRDAMLQASGVGENLVELLLQLLTVGQPRQEIVLGHALQAVLGFMAQVRIALDRGQQLVGGIDPQAQLVFLMAFEQRNLMLAGAVGVDLGEVFDDLRQRLGQQPVIHQVQHQAHGQRPQHAGNEDDHRVDQETFAVGGGVEGDAEVAVVLAVRPTADQLSGVGALLAQQQVGQPAHRHIAQRARLFREHGFVGVADRGHAHRTVLEQAFHHLHAHLAVEAVDRLSGRVAEHVEDALGVVIDGLAGLVRVIDDLRATEDDADRQRRKKHDPEQLDR